MEIRRTGEGYGAEGRPHSDHFDEEFDYMLFRQDTNGRECVHFMSTGREVTAMYRKIGSGEILVNPSYSILYCRTERLRKGAPDFGCHAAVREKKEKNG